MVTDRLISRLNAHAEALPRKRVDELEAGDVLTGVGAIAAVDRDPDGTVVLRFADGYSMHLSDTAEHWRVGPASLAERAYDIYDRASAVVYMRRRSGRVSYYLGPVAIHCWRRPLGAQASWVGFDRFR